MRCETQGVHPCRPPLAPPATPSVSPHPDPLKPALERVQTELSARLDEACSKHAPDESTGELIKLEELLTEAAQAAKEAISIRRRLRVDREQGVATADADAPPDAAGEGVRDFTDASGRAWSVWEVPAEQLSARSRPGAYAGEYQSGWLAFESADGVERRRLPDYPRDWRELSNERIETLCRSARLVTRRRRPEVDQGIGASPDSEERDPPTA